MNMLYKSRSRSKVKTLLHVRTHDIVRKQFAYIVCKQLDNDATYCMCRHCLLDNVSQLDEFNNKQI